jgi:hypothetical protein
MRATLVIFLFIYLGTPYSNGQSVASIQNVDFQLFENKLIITYDISNYKYSDKFNITPQIYKVSGEKINAKTISGDLINVLGGPAKKIIWEIEKDNILLNDDIYVIIIGEKIEEVKPVLTTAAHSVNKGACFFKSLVFPGWGSSRLINKNIHLIKGFLGYGAAIGAIIFNIKANNAYDNYKNMTLYSDVRKEYYDEMKKNNLYSIVFASGAGFIWGLDLITVLAVKPKTSANPSTSSTITIGYKSINYTPALALRLTF